MTIAAWKRHLTARMAYGGRTAGLAVMLLTLGAAVPAAGAAQSERPQVLLVALDGFHPDYLERFPTPNLRRLAARGVRARWMRPVMPSLTFPNFYTLATGLYPARHGIVNNTMMDPGDGARFRIGDTAAVRSSRWWSGEPLWVTAVRQGRRAASYFWVGSEAEVGGVRPTIWKPYQESVAYTDRVDSVLAWLSAPPGQRMDFVTLYFDEPDGRGHSDGPEDPRLAGIIDTMDAVMGRLLDGLAARGLADRVNVIVVSDHGMSQLSTERVVVLDDVLDRNSVEILSLSPFIHIRPRGALTPDSVVAALNRLPHVRAFTRETTPEGWRYRGHPRIPPVVGVVDPGWVLTTRAAMATASRRPGTGGAHGFEHTDSTMRALFLAAGPAFRRGAVVEPFQNIHVYELVCHLLGLRPAPNDGSLDSVRVMVR